MVIYKYELAFIKFENYIFKSGQIFFLGTKVESIFNYISYILMIYRGGS